jgi:adenine-specific DNA-methyltransferase
MSDVWYTPDETFQSQLIGLEDNVKADRTSVDLLFQLLLEWGLDLSIPIRESQVDGFRVFDVDNGAIVACFDSNISLDLVRSIAMTAPLRFVCASASFGSDDARVNAEQLFREISTLTQMSSV